MYLQIIKITPEILHKAEKHFSASFCNKLKEEKPGTYNESLVARYMIEKNKSNYSSISHKKNLVFIGIDNNKIGVDIEIIKQRDDHILEKFSNDEYKALKPSADKWRNFYTLWTAKEAIIKYENLFLDDIENIILNKAEEFFGNIGGIDFQNKLIFKYKKKKFIVYSGQEKNTIFSVCVSSEIG